jgi:hypothetical protein
MSFFASKHSPHAISRRSLFKAGAATGVAAATVTILSGCNNQTTQEDVAEPMDVSEDTGTEILTTYTSADFPYTASNEWTLPLGNVLHPAEGTWIPVTTAGSSATPMVKASALSLSSGQLSTVVEAPLTNTTTTVIYSVACSDSVYAWVELDLISRSWSLYASEFSEGALTGETKTLWQADSNWDPAPLACSGRYVLWLVQPATSGNQTTESSHCYLWTAGSSDASDVLESPGRFATPPTVNDSAVVLTPRVRADEGTYYGITAYSLDDGLQTKIDQLVMPASVRPFRACRMGDNFVLSVEANYDSGGLLGNMGTYIGNGSSDSFLYLSREPFACPSGKDGVYFIKSRSSYIVANSTDQTYSVLASADRSVDYGEYPARVGNCDTFVTFSSVKDATTGYPASVTVRTFPL